MNTILLPTSGDYFAVILTLSSCLLSLQALDDDGIEKLF